MAELHHGTGELPVAREPVHLLPVLDWVARVEPVCVLELYRFPNTTDDQSERFLFRF